jgi:hypothetical protein
VVNSEVEFRDASTLLPQKRLRNSKCTGLNDQHLVLRNHGPKVTGRGVEGVGLKSCEAESRAEQRASGVERVNRIEKSVAVWSEATK